MAAPVRPLLILGTRTLAVEIADVASEIPGLQVAAFVENLEPARCRETLEDLPILWVDDVAELAGSHLAVCALATTHRGRFVEQVARHGVRFATLVHPSARVSSTSSLGEGTLVSVGSIVASHARLGRHVIVNRGVLVGHHTRIDDYATLQPGANIAGACHIGAGTYVGMGAVVVDRVTIGAHAFVGAGSVVTKDVPDHVQVFGVPARVIRRNITGR